MDKDIILLRLRDCIKNFLVDIEKQTRLSIEFESLDSCVVAEYKFIPSSTAIIRLRDGWEDVDLAHELTHMKLELVDKFSILAWRSGVSQSEAIERAFGRIRTYVDDVVVYARLASENYIIDGEVFKANLFDDLYTKVPRYLKQLRLKSNDGMAHLDDIGYGDLCRSSFLVHAELLLKFYSVELSDEHRKKAKRFIEAFRLYLSPEAEKADKILDLFKENDVQTIDGHKTILNEWMKMEKLDKFVGISCYECCNTGFVLPYPA
ncbi:MAG: hypothetical protein P9X22_00020 [Candidatus Zapsychrus exili]|nr:hypothetical protein [Candidatus Zapsychrus exili]